MSKNWKFAKQSSGLQHIQTFVAQICTALSFGLTLGACSSRNFEQGGETQAGVTVPPSKDGKDLSDWDVNDISILYPLKRFGQSGPSNALIRLSDGLLSSVQFRSVLNSMSSDFKLDFSKGGQASLMNTLEKWAVIALRIQPCGRKAVTDPCQPVVNIVAQPVVPNESDTAEFALHLTYNPGLSSLTLLNEMIALRNRTAKNPKGTLGRPLGPHPILASEGLESPFAQALKTDFILKHMSSKNLLSVATTFVEPNRLQPWVFTFADAKTLDKPQRHSIFMFDPGTSDNACDVKRGQLVCERNFATGKIQDSEQRRRANPTGNVPSGTTPDGIPYIDDFLFVTQVDPQRGFPRANAQLQMWRNTMDAIENPHRVSPGQTNCSTCHRPHTERSRFRGYIDLTAGGPQAFVPASGNGCTPGSSVNTLAKPLKTINVRLFGYLHRDPVVSGRVINETLDACSILRGRL